MNRPDEEGFGGAQLTGGHLAPLISLAFGLLIRSRVSAELRSLRDGSLTLPALDLTPDQVLPPPTSLTRVDRGTDDVLCWLASVQAKGADQTQSSGGVY
jgi:hypothetical protein